MIINDKCYFIYIIVTCYFLFTTKIIQNNNDVNDYKYNLQFQLQ